MKFFKKKKLYYLLFFANFFLESCSTSSVPLKKNPSFQKIALSLSKEERVWMEKFFKEFFLEEASIYTLFGTKPISAGTLVYATEEEFRKATLLYLEKEKIIGKERKKILSLALKNFREDDFREHWERWITFIEKYPESPFLFAKHPTLSDKIWSAHILNVQETVWALQKYYDIFKNQLGFDFDPVSVTMDFKNEESAFWRQVFSNHLLTGIVYGFGYKNAYFFSRYIKDPNESMGEHSLFSSLVRERESNNESFSIERIILPRFRSFGLPFNEDPVLEKYKLEREKIKVKLDKSNFFEMVFLQLTGELPKSSFY